MVSLPKPSIVSIQYKIITGNRKIKKTVVWGRMGENFQDAGDINGKWRKEQRLQLQRRDRGRSIQKKKEGKRQRKTDLFYKATGILY